MAQEQHTKGPLEVRMVGTCSAAWAEIGYWHGSGEGLQWRMLAQTDTTHVEKETAAAGSRSRGDINERPARFQPTDQAAELIANARLWAVSARVFEALRACELALTMAGHPEICTVDPAATLQLARTVLAETTAWITAAPQPTKP